MMMTISSQKLRILIQLMMLGMNSQFRCLLMISSMMKQKIAENKYDYYLSPILNTWRTMGIIISEGEINKFNLDQFSLSQQKVWAKANNLLSKPSLSI